LGSVPDGAFASVGNKEGGEFFVVESFGGRHYSIKEKRVIQGRSIKGWARWDFVRSEGKMVGVSWMA
jgi:hypothetical protein